MSTNLPSICRAKIIGSNFWVYGYYAYKETLKEHFILQEEMMPYSLDLFFGEIRVIPETVAQLRHKNSNGEYYDGDVYYHAGFGFETVSGICRLQEALNTGNGDDIGEIKGNIFDTPDILAQLETAKSQLSPTSPKK